MHTKLNNEDFYFEDDSKAEELNIDFKKYFQMLLKRKWIILAISVLITVPWIYNVQKEPPIYKTSTTIRFRNLAAGTPDVIDQGRITELTSRTFAEDVVAQLGLTLLIDEKLEIFRQDLFDEFVTTKDPETGMYALHMQYDSLYSIGRVIQNKEKEIFRGNISTAKEEFQKTDYGFSFRFVKNLRSMPNEINFKINNFRTAVEYFQNRTRVTPIGGGLLLLEMADTNPVFVAKKVNRLAEIFVEESKKLKRTTIENQKNTIAEQLSFADKELRQADEELMQFKSRHKVSLSAEIEEVVRNLNEAEGNLEQLKKNRNDLNELLQKIDSYQNDPENKNKIKYVYQQISELSAFSSNPKMGLLRKQLMDAEQEYDAVSATYTPDNEKAVKLQNELNLLYSQIHRESRQQLTELDRAISATSSNQANFEYKLKRLPEEEYTLTELDRQLAAKAEVRKELLAKMQLVQLSDAVETEIVDILDPALIPEAPMNREKRMKMVVGALLGFIAGISVAFVLEFLDKAIKTVDDVKRYLKLQVLGTIPHIEFKDVYDYQDSEKIKQIDQQLVTYDYSPTPIGEAYRSLRTNLVYSKNTGRVQSFVVTSAAPGDGKSFTSANIAISMAQHKSNTLLIDGDLRRGVLHNTYGIPKEPGLTNYLTGMVGLQHIVNDTLIPNLSMISCGSLLPNPSELLGSHQMQRFLDEAKRKFDVIIFDSPPLNAATDAIVLGTQVDALVLVVRSGVTNRDIAKQKLELFRNVPVKILGVILNGTTNDFGHDGYSYYHY